MGVFRFKKIQIGKVWPTRNKNAEKLGKLENKQVTSGLRNYFVVINFHAVTTVLTTGKFSRINATHSQL